MRNLPALIPTATPSQDNAAETKTANTVGLNYAGISKHTLKPE